MKDNKFKSLNLTTKGSYMKITREQAATITTLTSGQIQSIFGNLSDESKYLIKAFGLGADIEIYNSEILKWESAVSENGSIDMKEIPFYRINPEYIKHYSDHEQDLVEIICRAEKYVDKPAFYVGDVSYVCDKTDGSLDIIQDAIVIQVGTSSAHERLVNILKRYCREIVD